MTRLTAAVTSLVLALSAPAMAGDGHAHDDHGAEPPHSFEGAGLHVVHPWMAATEGNTALIFMEIENETDAEIVIQGARADFASHVHLAGFQLVNGEASYVELPAMPIGAGKHLDFEPGALAVLVEDLNRHFHEGDTVEIHLLTSAGEFELIVAVEAEGATQHSHAGHSH